MTGATHESLEAIAAERTFFEGRDHARIAELADRLDLDSLATLDRLASHLAKRAIRQSALTEQLLEECGSGEQGEDEAGDKAAGAGHEVTGGDSSSLDAAVPEALDGPARVPAEWASAARAQASAARAQASAANAQASAAKAQASAAHAAALAEISRALTARATYIDTVLSRLDLEEGGFAG